ncbi:MAG: helix-turn-helix domain-containing protein [Brevundimonas sp.]|nr:helix-turn-helix domain-containing protein [Caulobacteraceae bacterium]
MKITNLTTDDAVLEEFGRRMAEARLAKAMTQAQFALAAGVSKRTIERLEDGGSVQVANLVRCLRALGKLEGLDRLVPETPPNPIDLLERQGKTRQRARPDADSGAGGGAPWTWGDET